MLSYGLVARKTSKLLFVFWSVVLILTAGTSGWARRSR